MPQYTPVGAQHGGGALKRKVRFPSFGKTRLRKGHIGGKVHAYYVRTYVVDFGEPSDLGSVGRYAVRRACNNGHG